MQARYCNFCRRPVYSSTFKNPWTCPHKDYEDLLQPGDSQNILAEVKEEGGGSDEVYRSIFGHRWL